MQNSVQPKGDVDSIPLPPSEKIGKVRAPRRKLSEKVQKSKSSYKSPIEMATASDLEILRKVQPLVQFSS